MGTHQAPGYWKHKRDHYRSMVAISKQPNARVLQLLQLYPAADKPTLHVPPPFTPFTPDFS